MQCIGSPCKQKLRARVCAVRQRAALQHRPALEEAARLERLRGEERSNRRSGEGHQCPLAHIKLPEAQRALSGGRV